VSTPAKVAACDMGYEEIFEGLDAFCRRPDPAVRSMTLHPIFGGVLVKLIENGRVFEGRGKRCEDAMANALEALAEGS
jgi:hypothetical protein